MNDQLKEQISAYVDDELSTDETALLLRQLAADPALREQANAYIELGRQMRGQSQGAVPDLRLSILQSLESDTSAPVIDDVPATASAARWLRPVAGGAIAAVVAVIAINMLPEAPSSDVAPAAAIVQTNESTPASDAFEPAYEYIVPASITDSGLVSADPELAAYFLRHSVSRPSLAPGSGRARMLSEAAAVDDNDDQSTAGEVSAP
ncbi:MAG: RseA family anti-sigma factor [Pseudomonadota bacterium]